MDDDRRPKLPVLDAFSLDGVTEDGLTDSHRSVLTEALVPPGPPPPPPPQPPVVARAQRLFALLCAYLPKRITNEELGDALESIHEMLRRGAPWWKVHAKVASVAFWVIAHTGGELGLRPVGAVKKKLLP